jgi:hypothetical protein
MNVAALFGANEKTPQSPPIYDRQMAESVDKTLNL